MKERLKRAGKKFLVAFLFMAAWAVLARGVDRELLLPTPWAVLRTLGELAGQGEFWQSIALSLWRVLLGYLGGVIVAVLLAVLCAVSSTMKEVIFPALRVIRSTPVASFILLALVWLPSPQVPVLTAALMVIPVVFGPLLQAIEDVDVELLEMMHFFRIKKRTVIRKLYIPSVAPQFGAACVTAEGLAWKASIAAEVLATPALSIGKGIYETKLYLETPELFAWTLTVILLSVGFEELVKRIFAATAGRKKAALSVQRGEI